MATKMSIAFRVWQQGKALSHRPQCEHTKVWVRASASVCVCVEKQEESMWFDMLNAQASIPHRKKSKLHFIVCSYAHTQTNTHSGVYLCIDSVNNIGSIDLNLNAMGAKKFFFLLNLTNQLAIIIHSGKRFYNPSFYGSTKREKNDAITENYPIKTTRK